MGFGISDKAKNNFQKRNENVSLEKTRQSQTDPKQRSDLR